DQGLEQDGLARARGSEHHADLTCGHRQRDVAPDQLVAEGLGQTLDLYLYTHGSAALPVSRPRVTRWSYGCSTGTTPRSYGRVTSTVTGRRVEMARLARAQRTASGPPRGPPAVGG